MIRFLQISDFHFADTNGNDDEYRQMKCKFLEDIASCHTSMGRIDYILICGDITSQDLINVEPFSEVDWVGVFGPQTQGFGKFVGYIHNIIVA